MAKKRLLPQEWQRDREGYLTSVPDFSRRISREFDSMLNDFFMTPVVNFFRTPSITDIDWGFNKGNLLPRIDFYDDEKNYYADVELPGIEEKDINISVREGRVEIKGERKHEEEKREKGFYRSEREYGNYYRSISLPTDVNTDEVQAHYKNGVLKLVMPKSEERQKEGKRIEITKEK